MKKSFLLKIFALLSIVTLINPLIYAASDTDVNPPTAQDSDNQYSSVGAPPEVAPAPPVVSGSEKITLELKGVNVLDVLKILAKRSGLNIVAGKDVRGDVTIYMQNVEVRKALDTIIRTLGLAYDEKDGILTVMSDREYTSRYGKPFRDRRVTETFHIKHANPQTMNQLLPQMKSSSGRLAIDERTATLIVTDNPEVVKEMRRAVDEFDKALITKVFTLKYGKAADLGEELKEFLSPNVGIVKIDKRSNQISITDREEIIGEIAKIVDAFDMQPPQVLIEAKVVEVQLYDAFRFGIDWNYVGLKIAQIRDVQLKSAQAVSAPGSTLGSGTLSTFTIGAAGKDKFQTVVDILQNLGKTNILSSPSLLCLNNEEAKLAVATKQPYVTQTVNITTSSSNTADDVKFVDVGVTLSIVPTISNDGHVVLKVKPEVSSSNSTFTIQGVAQGSNTLFDRTKVPIVTSQTIETTIFAKDNETVVIGGLIQNRESKVRKKFPVLGDIPFIGAVFRTETNDFNKTELVVFLTPHIVTGNTSTLEERKYLNQDNDLINFDKVGGYDFTKGEGVSSEGFFRMDDKPYYKSPVKDKPIYFSPKDSAIRNLEYGDQMDQYAKNSKGSEEGQVIGPMPKLAAEHKKAEVSVQPIQPQETPVAPKPTANQENKPSLNVEKQENKISVPEKPVVKEEKPVNQAAQTVAVAPNVQINKEKLKTSNQPTEEIQTAKEIPAQEPELTAPTRARRQYRESVARAVKDALDLHHDLGKYPLQIQLFIIIERDGRLTLKQVVHDTGLTAAGRAPVLETLQKLSPFPPFPTDMNSERELIDFKIDLS